MKLTFLLTALALPFGTLAAPSPTLPTLELQERSPVHADPIVELAHALLPRQSGLPSLGDLLGDLLPTLQAIGGLLNSDTINKIKTVIDGLATVLGNKRAENTGNLLDQVGGLLNKELIDQLKGLLPSVGKLLNEENINKIGSLLSNAGDLLTEKFVDQISGLINDVAPLVSAIAQIVTTLLQALLGGGG